MLRSLVGSLFLLAALPLAAGELQFDAKGVTATVTPYATTYWLCSGAIVVSPRYFRQYQAILEDSDGDGIVRWEFGKRNMIDGLFTMIDGTSGSITTRSNDSAEVAAAPFPAKAFLRDESGALSRFALNLADLPKVTSSKVLWVRPGTGAWSRVAADSDWLDELNRTPLNTLWDVRAMSPVGSSPPAPSGVEAGDYFVVQGVAGDFWTGGLVDSHLNEASGGGRILHSRTTGDEDARKITITLARIDGTDGPVSLHYQTEDGSARAGLLYEARSGDVVFQPGQIFSSFDIPVIDNNDPSEGTFKVHLSAASGASLGVTSFESYILDNDATPLALFPSVSVPEGDGGLKEATYVVALNHTAPKPVTLHWEMRDRFNVAQVIASGTLEYAVGEKEKPIKVRYVADDIHGYPKSWSVEATSAVNAATRPPGSLSIIEDDPSPAMTFTGTTVSESAGHAIVTVTYSEAFTFSFLALAYTDDGTATAPSDYEGAPDGFHFDVVKGVPTATIAIPIRDDAIAEGVETFEVLVHQLGTQDFIPVTVTIVDDDSTVPPKRRSIRH